MSSIERRLLDLAPGCPNAETVWQFDDAVEVLLGVGAVFYYSSHGVGSVLVLHGGGSVFNNGSRLSAAYRW